MGGKLFLIAGEASGDLHGSNLIREIRRQSPQTALYGWGGDRMQEAGCQIRKHYRELAFMGFYEVFKNIFTIIQNFKLVKRQIEEIQPDIVVLIDYPGFNLRLLPWLHEKGIKTVYYIAPQAWAWKESRVRTMARYIDLLLVILPFEQAFFSERGVPTEFVGHPLLQEISDTPSPKEDKIALLPGSRAQEIRAILPRMLAAMEYFPDYQFQLAAMSYLGEDFYHSIIGDRPVSILWDSSDDVIRTSKLAWVSSGTATLQTALYLTPLIVCYRSGWLNYQLAKRLIQVPYISLVNLIFNRLVVKELIQENFSVENLTHETKNLLEEKNYHAMQNEFQSLRTLLGEQNASQRAAEIILTFLNK